jgi:hypothetical protein
MRKSIHLFIATTFFLLIGLMVVITIVDFLQVIGFHIVQ